MALSERLPAVTPARGAIVYVVVGSLWILFSDQFVNAVAPDRTMATFFQTVKGVSFVALTTVFVYIVTRAQYEQREQLDRLVRADLQHISILHRILRHNVRNQCSIILGYLDSVERHVPDAERDQTVGIRDSVDRLLSLSEKSSRLNRAVSDDGTGGQVVDIGGAVADAVDAVLDRHPNVHVTADAPEEPTRAVVPKAFDWVLGELFENAIEHNDREAPRVTVTVEDSPESVVVRVADNGPGLPPVERDLLERGAETPIQHSDGVGLWVVRILTMRVGGTCELVTDGSEGTTLELTLPKPNGPLDEETRVDRRVPRDAVAPKHARF